LFICAGYPKTVEPTTETIYTEFNTREGERMKLKLNEDRSLKEAVIDITFNMFDRHIQKIVDTINLGNVKLEGVLKDKHYFLVSYDVCYLESVDGRSFIYTESDVYESKEKLYELEEKLKGTSFVKINKQTLLNMDYLESVAPMSNYRLEATLKNKEKVIISRHYMKEVKDYLKL
jgi:DNA-binding LytR/AlgR family response regulator